MNTKDENGGSFSLRYVPQQSRRFNDPAIVPRANDPTRRCWRSICSGRCEAGKWRSRECSCGIRWKRSAKVTSRKWLLGLAPRSRSDLADRAETSSTEFRERHRCAPKALSPPGRCSNSFREKWRGKSPFRTRGMSTNWADPASACCFLCDVCRRCVPRNRVRSERIYSQLRPCGAGGRAWLRVAVTSPPVRSPPEDVLEVPWVANIG